MPAYGSKNSRGKRIYRCRQLPGGGGGHTARLADQVDKWITELVVARLSREDAIDLGQTGFTEWGRPSPMPRGSYPGASVRR